MTRTLVWLAALALNASPVVTAGCGGDDDDDHVSGDGDGDTDADTDADADADGDIDSDARALVLTSDFATSVYGWIALRDLSAFHELGPAEGDATVVKTGSRFFIIERTLGAITLLAEDLSIERNFSVADEGGPAPNPHDIALVSDTKAYVTRYGQGTIAIVDPSTGALTGTIDLSAHDPDGVPDMDSITAVDGLAYVALEILDETFTPRANGEVVLIDTATDEVSRTITIPAMNPYGRFRVGATGDLLLPCAGVYGPADGGIVALPPGGDAASILLGEDALAGDVNTFVVADSTHGFAIVARDFVTHLVPFEPSAGTVGDPILSSEGWDLRDVELVGDTIVVADGAPTAPGLRFFDIDGHELTDAPVDVGLPPAIVLPL